MTQLSDAVGAMERALARLWLDDDVTRGSVRAHTMSFVAVCGRSHREQFVTDVDDLAARLGSRTCIVTVDPTVEPWHLDGDVSAVCRVPAAGESPKVCAERIELTFGAVAARRARSVVEALTEASLPLVVYGGPGASPDVLAALAPASSRLVIDSAELGTARSSALARETGVRIEDLAFVRARNWREMIARGFDDPRHAHAAFEVREVHVRHVGGDHAGAEAHAELLVGWLATQLEWRTEGGRIRGRDGSPIGVVLESIDRAGLAVSLLESVTVTARLGSGSLRVEVARDDHPAHLRWSLSEGGATVERTFVVTRRSQADLVCRAAEEVRRTDGAERALAFVREWRAA